MSDYGSDDYDSDECVHCCRITSELYVVPGEPGSPQRCRDCETDRLGEDPEEWWARWRAEQSATLPRAVSEGTEETSRRRNVHCSRCGDTRGGPIGHETSECTWRHGD